MEKEGKWELVLYEDLVTRHVDLVFHMACSWCRDPELAEELTQRAFVKGWLGFEQFHQGTNFKAWILKILRNVFLDWKRAEAPGSGEKFAEQVSFQEEPQAACPPPQAVDLDNKEIFYDLFGDEIGRILKKLPREFQIAVLLFDVEGLSYAEIAHILDLPVGTIRSRIHRGRAMLFEGLREYARGVGYLREKKS